MMVIFQLPAWSTSLEQVRAVIRILEIHAPGHRKGIQLLCPKDLLTDSQKLALFHQAKREIPPLYTITYHAPISPHTNDPELNVLSPLSIQYYQDFARVLKSSAEDVLVIHTNTVFSAAEWKEPLTEYGYIVKTMRPMIVQHLRQITKGIPLRLVVENLPFPLLGDKTADISQIPFDPFLLTMIQLQEFLQGLPEVGLAFDTAHYGLMAQHINYLWEKYGHFITTQDIAQEGFAGIYPEMVRKQPSLLEAFHQLQERGRIFHVQLADYEGQWSPKIGENKGTLFQEGTMVGQGQLGEQLLDLVVDISKNNPDLPVSMDIHVDDFLQRPEQVESLRRVVAGLH